MSAYVLFPSLTGFVTEIQHSKIPMIRIQPEYISGSSVLTITTKNVEGDILAARIVVEERSMGWSREGEKTNRLVQASVKRMIGRLQEVTKIITREFRNIGVTDIRSGTFMVPGLAEDIESLETNADDFWRIEQTDEFKDETRYLVDVAVQGRS